MSSSFQAEKLVVGNEALYVKRVPIDRLIDLLLQPVEWFKPGNLRRPFLIGIQGFQTEAAEHSSILTECIDNTNLATIQMSRLSRFQNVFMAALMRRLGGAVPQGSSKGFEKALKEVAKSFNFDRIVHDYLGGTEVHITLMPHEERAFIHFEVWQTPVGLPSDLHVKIHKGLTLALFHCMAATEQNYLHNVVINPNNDFRVRAYESSEEGVREIEIQGPKPRCQRPQGPIPLFFMGDDTNKDVACEMLIAMYQAGEITYEQAYCKIYH